MKKLFENYQKFINEQQDYFYTYLASSFSHKWDDDIWYVGLHYMVLVGCKVLVNQLYLLV